MDKSTIPYDIQHKFFSDCRKAYSACAGKQEHKLYLKLFETNVEICLPAKSHISQLLKVSGKGSIPDTDFSIFIADSGCEGFDMPESPFDRYSFTRRGDISGSEESAIKPIFFHKYSSVCSVNQDEKSAFILIREPSLLIPEGLSHMLISVIAILLKSSGILFLPVRCIRSDNTYVLLAEPDNTLQNISAVPPQKITPEPVANWAAIRIYPDLKMMAVPFPGNKHDKITFEPFVTGSMRFSNDNRSAKKDISELITIRHFSTLTFQTHSLLPFSGVCQMEMIENLSMQLTANRSSGFAMPPPGILLPSLSAIIPAFNAAKFLHETVQSIASLNYPNTEVIIVDDGSTDETRMLIPDLPVKCRYLYQPNRGASAARNYGFKASTGEVVLFLDADDLVNVPAFYSLLDHLMSNPDAIAVTGFVQKFMDKGDGSRIFTGSPAESYPWYIGAALFRRDAIEKNGPFDEELRFSEDTDWFIRAREKNLVVLRSPEISLFVRRHDKNLTKDTSLEDLQILTMLKKKIARRS